MTFEIACVFLAETDSAVKIFDPASDEEFWIPLSQVEEIHGRKADKTGEGTIVMSDWIARQKGLL